MLVTLGDDDRAESPRSDEEAWLDAPADCRLDPMDEGHVRSLPLGIAGGGDASYTFDVPCDLERGGEPARFNGRGAAHSARMAETYERSFRGAASRPPAPMASSRQDFENDDPGVFTDNGVAPVFSSGSEVDAATGAIRRLVLDEHGAEIKWPWEGGSAERPPPGALSEGRPLRAGPGPDHVAAYFAASSPYHDPIGAHAADATVQAGLNAATADGKGGENSTGVRKYKAFCRKYGRAVLRPIDPNAPLWVKLSEEQWCMRFISEIIDDASLAVVTGRGYFGAACAWHLRKTGVGFGAGMDMKRLTAMVKGLKKLRDGPPQQMRRGISPKQLREGMDIVYPPVTRENVNIRAMLSTGLQGLMRGRELGAEGSFDHELDVARGDISTATAERLAFFCRPAKNMRHTRGKTVPIVIGGGGDFIDACAEVTRMLELDPTPPGRAATTPMFRKANGSAFVTDDIRDIVRQICIAIGLDPMLFGAHSLRIGGATALFAAGADPIHIRTMGRWSSDCYRLYVRACFQQTLAWTRKLGSQQVHDIQGTYERNAQETEEY